MKRKVFSVTLANDVRNAIEQRARETGVPMSRLLDLSVRRAFNLPSPPEPLPPEMAEERRASTLADQIADERARQNPVEARRTSSTVRSRRR